MLILFPPVHSIFECEENYTGNSKQGNTQFNEMKSRLLAINWKKRTMRPPLANLD